MNKVIFTEPEKELIRHLQETMGMSILESTESMIKYKRNLAFYHEQKGNFALAEHLLKELGEWDESRRELQKEQAVHQDIILP